MGSATLISAGRAHATLIIAGVAFVLAVLSQGSMHAQDAEPELAPGRGAFLNAPRDAAVNRPDRLSQGPLTVRYLDADVVAVIDDIVGEVLALDYTIAADVQGRISLRMTEVTSREAVLEQLQTALAAINVAMIDRGGFLGDWRWRRKTCGHKNGAGHGLVFQDASCSPRRAAGSLAGSDRPCHRCSTRRFACPCSD